MDIHGHAIASNGVIYSQILITKSSSVRRQTLLASLASCYILAVYQCLAKSKGYKCQFAQAFSFPCATTKDDIDMIQNVMENTNSVEETAKQTSLLINKLQDIVQLQNKAKHNKRRILPK
uniref:Uncharacterized protein LOC114332126 n=1 Tax=Diabrotica virgifera virgifera TaxID=50390 RepID=A0A6P7FS91_DIAVI